MKKVILIFSVLLIALGVSFFIIKQCHIPILFSVQEYTPGMRNCKGEVDKNYFLEKSSDFEIGANIKGYAVFKHPNKAFQTFVSTYESSLNKIKEEFDLENITKDNYQVYLQYGWQVKWYTRRTRRNSICFSIFRYI